MTLPLRMILRIFIFLGLVLIVNISTAAAAPVDFVFSLSCKKINNASNANSFDGAANFTPNGGAPPYNFQVLNSANTVVNSGRLPTDGTAQLNNLAGGTYTIQVTDQNETKNCTLIIGLNSCDLMVNIPSASVNCAGDLGSLMPNVTGGVAPLSYSWSNGNMTKNLSNVPSGNYTLMVSDDAGCSKTIGATIAALMPLVLSPTPTTATNAQSADGLVNISINGGTPPYAVNVKNNSGSINFSLSNFPTPTDINNLPAGNYTATVTDSKSCSTIKTFQIGVNTCLFVVTVADIMSKCKESDNELTTVDIQPGVAPFSYIWSNGGTSKSIANLSPDTYTVTATDAIGCSSITSGTVMGNDMLQINCVVTQNVSLIGGMDGAVSIKITNGIPSYDLTITNLKTNSSNFFPNSGGMVSLGNLKSANYRAVVTDQNNCTQSCMFEIKEPDCGVNIQLDDLILPCNMTTGTLQAVISGGQPPYTINWNNGVMTTTNVNLAPNSYTITVIDALNCEKTKTVKVLDAFRDEDGDGFFVGCADYSIISGPDCDDNDATVYPNAPEICDGKDNNCDGRTDDGAIDSDGDGASDCSDKCPDDPGKTSPGECGCGVYEDTRDYDRDGVIGCKDGCPYDGNKIVPGNCGCGELETPDSDGDGVVDCLDECPNNSAKVLAGTCGCDAPGITNIELRNYSECDNQGTSDPSDDEFYVDVYVYFDAAPELGALNLKGDIDAYYHFQNGNREPLIILYNQQLKANGQLIKFIAEYKGNEDCNYFFKRQRAVNNCSRNACNAPQNILTNVIGNKVALDWGRVDHAVSYEYKYRVLGAKDWIAQWTDQTQCEICDLETSTTYEYQVRTLCQNEYSSAYTEGTFITQNGSANCYEIESTGICEIQATKVINIRNCNDKGTIFQKDDFFYADLLIYYKDIPSSGFLIIEGSVNKMIKITDLNQHDVHHLENLKIFENKGILDLKVYFSAEPNCAYDITYDIPYNPCYNGQLYPSGHNAKQAEDTKGGALQIGPNPVKDQLRIDFGFKRNKRNMVVLVHNFLGQQEIMKALNNTEEQLNLDVSGLENGLHYLTVSSGSIRKTVKFVKDSVE